jgi:hypothetical protein
MRKMLWILRDTCDSDKFDFVAWDNAMDALAKMEIML